jgi:hypothetical protein
MGARMRARRVPAALLVVGVLVLAVTVFPTSAVSGSVDFEILKVVNGTPPPGAEFVATLSCDGGVTVDPGGQSQTTVRFDAGGVPTDAASFQLQGTGTCTVTETQAGGAGTVSYQCARTAGETDGAPPLCPVGAPQPDPVTLTVVTPHSPSSVTVTNTFEQAPTPIVAPSTFTG